MKKNMINLMLMAFVLCTTSVLYAQETVVRDTLVMGPGYADDIYYSFENGEVAKVARGDWDIAFYTPRFSAGILINEGNGVQLFSYPDGDTSAWSAIDTSGMASWSPMHNSPEVWEEGAFNANASGHPDYGWGVYNSVDHYVYGDSLFVIATPSGIKKLRIIVKKSVENIYKFVYADLDGGNEQMVELEVEPYESKYFVYYSLENNEVLDREPAKEDWDILFTKYIDMVETNEGTFSPYLVTGATNNAAVFCKNFYPVAPDFNDWFPGNFDSTKNAIGYDWKTFDMGSFEWVVEDSNYYFVKTYNSDIYKLQFIDWEGSMTGVFVLDKWLVSLSAVEQAEVPENAFDIYPNPSFGDINLKAPVALNGNYAVRIMDQAGRQVYSENLNGSQLNGGFKLSVLDMPAGIYIVLVTGNNYASSQKLIIR